MASIQLYYSERVLFNLLHKATTETLLQIQAHFTLICSITVSFLTHQSAMNDSTLKSTNCLTSPSRQSPNAQHGKHSLCLMSSLTSPICMLSSSYTKLLRALYSQTFFGASVCMERKKNFSLSVSSREASI